MNEENALVVFQGVKVRRTWHNEEWWFSVFDIVIALTDSRDPKQYVKKMRQRDEPLNSNWGTICTPLEMTALDGKKRKVNCVNTAGAFRIIQSIPSPKAEPFKLWLARVGYERIEETEDPEKAIQRALATYLKKGYSKEWVDFRLKSIEIRKDLTNEWQERGVKSNDEFAILTDDISFAWAGLKTKDYKKHKELRKENLRDNMTNLELVLNMLAETATTEISKKREPETFPENRQVAREGGGIAGSARKQIEAKTGKPVVSKLSFQKIQEQKKLKG